MQLSTLVAELGRARVRVTAEDADGAINEEWHIGLYAPADIVESLCLPKGNSGQLLTRAKVLNTAWCFTWPQSLPSPPHSPGFSEVFSLNRSPGLR